MGHCGIFRAEFCYRVLAAFSLWHAKFVIIIIIIIISIIGERGMEEMMGGRGTQKGWTL